MSLHTSRRSLSSSPAALGIKVRNPYNQGSKTASLHQPTNPPLFYNRWKLTEMVDSHDSAVDRSLTAVDRPTDSGRPSTVFQRPVFVLSRAVDRYQS